MPSASPVCRVRTIICQAFLELGSKSTEAPKETLLIRDGTYCGHRFQRDELQAVWFAEENQLKFYGLDGCVVKVVAPVDPRSDEARRAA